MKDDGNLKVETNATALCLNEIYIYNHVIPYYKKFLKPRNIKTFDTEKWVPKIYFADCKIIEELGDTEETILAMENLTPHKFRTGPRVDLDEIHLKLMATKIASYHAVSYAMRILKDPMLKTLVDGLIPYSFLSSDGGEPDAFKLFYQYGMERAFNYIVKEEKFYKNKNFIENIRRLKRDAYERPLPFMEKFLRRDEIFSIILHGDYNRNNVMFRYEDEDGHREPDDIRMIDFQEVRYASPAIDLSFFMYMNMPAGLRASLWDELFKLYHDTLIESIVDILKCKSNDPRLEPYSYGNFSGHFRQNALYGAMVATVFVPMMACPENECQRMIDLYDTDYASEELHKLTLFAGGKAVDERVTGILMHASEMGYMDILEW